MLLCHVNETNLEEGWGIGFNNGSESGYLFIFLFANSWAVWCIDQDAPSFVCTFLGMNAADFTFSSTCKYWVGVEKDSEVLLILRW